METKFILLIIFWIIGGVICIFTTKQVKDYKNYDNPKMFLCLGVLLSLIMSWAMIWANIINDSFYIPNCIYHDCMKHSKITFEDIDFDKDGNVMNEYDSDKFGHRETYRIYTCQYCGKIVKQERLQ